MSSEMNSDAGAAMGAGGGYGGVLPPLRPACEWCQSKDTTKVIDPPRRDLLAGAKKKPRTPLPDSPRPPEGSGVPAASQPKPKNSRTSAPGTAKSTPFLFSSGTSKYKKLKSSTSDKGGKSNGRKQPGDGFSKDENRNSGQPLGSRKRRAGDENSFRDNDDRGSSRFPDKRRRTEDNGELLQRDNDSSNAAAAQNGTSEVAQQDAGIEETTPAITEAPEVTESAINVASTYNGEVLQRVSNSSDATVDNDMSGPVQHNDAAAEILVALFGTMEVAQQDATIEETASAIEEPISTITEAPEATESVTIEASAQEDTRAAGMESSNSNEPILPGDSCIAAASSSALQV